jgi:hypothetical protein
MNLEQYKEYKNQKYTPLYSPDPILILTDGLKTDYVPDFHIDETSFFNLDNYESKGVNNVILIIILLILIFGVISNYVFRFKS